MQPLLVHVVKLLVVPTSFTVLACTQPFNKLCFVH